VGPGQAAVIEDAVAAVAAGRAGRFKLVIGVDRGAGMTRCWRPVPTSWSTTSRNQRPRGVHLYAACTAQYHINADIVYALRKYVKITGDLDFLDQFGAEMLVETARLWLSLGNYDTHDDNRFCVNGVTGPDE